ncbi:spore germination protein [Tissierella creatinini]|nr:spore germination protein [Tissierella creatinini]TJX63120.1 spore germination protein [Soehngenia saccharolytica]
MFVLTNSLDENIAFFKSTFSGDETFLTREFQSQNGSRFCLLYMDGMADLSIIANTIIMPILQMEKHTVINDMNILSTQIVSSGELKKSKEPMTLIDSIIRGDAVLLTEGVAEALIISCKGFKTRSIQEPEIEKTIRGPREGFTESLITNLSLIRRKLETKDLKFKYKTLGTKSRTKACICYIEGRADEKILEEVNKRIDSIEIDGLFGVKFIHDLTDDSPKSIFEMTGETEKPDVLAAKLLEGRIGILLDGTPTAMTFPFIFIENFQTGEDYYTNYYSASIRRITRILGFIVATSFPAIYLALVTYHKEALPPPFILSILSARQGVPFLSVVELLLLFFSFEILTEAGSRTPGYIGQSLGIVGALILGTAAVEARIVSAPMIIVVGISSVSSLMLPSIRSQIVILRLFYIIGAAVFGIYGVFLSMTVTLIHLFSLKSYGVLYMSTINSLYSKDLKDTYFRGPKWFIKRKRSGGEK